MAATFRELDELAQAEQYLRWAADYADEGNDPHLQAEARLGRAEFDLRRGDAASAEAAARAVASTFDRLGDPIAQADALRVVGAACVRLGRLDEAHQALGTALTLAQRYGSALGEAETLRASAELAEARGDHAEMRRLAQAAFARFGHMGAVEEARRLIVWVTERAGPA
jgi:ATP/maltotriose-dependent transcriptional regulator MalT